MASANALCHVAHCENEAKQKCSTCERVCCFDHMTFRGVADQWSRQDFCDGCRADEEKQELLKRRCKNLRKKMMSQLRRLQFSEARRTREEINDVGWNLTGEKRRESTYIPIEVGIANVVCVCLVIVTGYFFVFFAKNFLTFNDARDNPDFSVEEEVAMLKFAICGFVAMLICVVMEGFFKNYWNDYPLKIPSRSSVATHEAAQGAQDVD